MIFSSFHWIRFVSLLYIEVDRVSGQAVCATCVHPAELSIETEQTLQFTHCSVVWRVFIQISKCVVKTIYSIHVVGLRWRQNEGGGGRIVCDGRKT